MQDLRLEYNNYIEIYQDVREEHSVVKAKQSLKDQLTKKNSTILTQDKNSKFLNHELQFFISNLQKKAVESNLDENSLIP